jgi:hypothetical protein
MKARLERISWRELYQQAVHERDETKLNERVHLVEGALFERWVELSHGDQDCEELGEMKLAAQHLLSIKTDKLGWPPIFPCGTDPFSCGEASRNR